LNARRRLEIPDSPIFLIYQQLGTLVWADDSW
jgi:hypothetical protein